MQFTIINFENEPEGIEELLDKIPALTKLDSIYKWENDIGEIKIDIFPFPPHVQITSFDNSHTTKERIVNITKKIASNYKDCNISYKGIDKGLD